MRIFSRQFGRAWDGWWRRYICDEDADERRKRLCEEALGQIDAQLLSAIRARIAEQEWTSDLESQGRERRAA